MQVCTAPHYDFENELTARNLLRNQVTAAIGDVIANPEYRPEPQPLTERAPWLIYIVLAVSSIALASFSSVSRAVPREREPQPD